MPLIAHNKPVRLMQQLCLVATRHEAALCVGGQKVANVATFGMVGGEPKKKDGTGGKEAYKSPKVHTF